MFTDFLKIANKGVNLSPRFLPVEVGNAEFLCSLIPLLVQEGARGWSKKRSAGSVTVE
jgi:hypothetical protein